MKKNFVWIILLALLIFGVIYFKIFYPLSQGQLKNSFRHVIAAPIEHFYNSNGKTCGLWYERSVDGVFDRGRSNDRVKQCFQKAFDKCKNRNILLVKETGGNKLTYSFLQIIKANDQNECIMQHFFEEHDLDLNGNEREPLFFVNTCTVLADDFFGSCEPLYFSERKAKRAAELGFENDGEGIQ